MKNYQDSDFTLNKYSKGIVYRSVSGAIITYTLADYLAENPGKTEADFRAWKELSDNDYLITKRNEYNQTRKDVSLHGLDETEACSAPSPEDEIIEQPEQIAKEQQRRELGLRAFAALTEVQQRRYIQHYVYNKTVREIADLEGVKHQSVVECLDGAKKKIKKFLENSKKYPAKTPDFSH